MAAIQPAAVRAAVAARLDAQVAELVRESVEPMPFLRQTARSPVHLEFAVGVRRSEPLNGRGGDRQVAALGVLARTEVAVLIPYQVTKGRVTGYDAALAIQASVRNALAATGWTADFQLLWVRSEHEPGADGWLWLTDTFDALHLMPLVA